MARLIRWEGHPAPLEDPAILRAIARGVAPLALVERMRRFEHHERISVTPGRSVFGVGPAHGFSRRYEWGPRVFDVWMDEADWALLRANRWDRWMFRDVTEGPERPRPPLAKEGWRELFADFDVKPKARPLRG